MMEESKEGYDNFDPFKYPSIGELFHNLVNGLFKESGRGALLIATAYVDDHLTLLIEAAFPGDISNNHKDKLLKYPGPLSTFASKIELAYAFKLISRNLYDCLNALRTLRNSAAHSTSKFELHTLNEKLKSFYSFGPGVSDFILDISRKALVQDQIDLAKEILESDLEDVDKRIFDNILKDKKMIEKIEKQVPYWELVHGLTFLCGIIAFNKERLIILTKDIKSLSDFERIKENLSTSEENQI